MIGLSNVAVAAERRAPEWKCEKGGRPANMLLQLELFPVELAMSD
jgi:hypothetical protein